MKLGTLLLRNAAISLSQLEGGLRTQVLYGGRLGTNLVELGFLDIDTLGDQLGELYQIPVATRALLDAAPPEAINQISARTAQTLGAIPLGHQPPFMDTMAVAMIAISRLSVRPLTIYSPTVGADMWLLGLTMGGLGTISCAAATTSLQRSSI